jgi:hypothetical protein
VYVTAVQSLIGAMSLESGFGPVLRLVETTLLPILRSSSPEYERLAELTANSHYASGDVIQGVEGDETNIMPSYSSPRAASQHAIPDQ